MAITEASFIETEISEPINPFPSSYLSRLLHEHIAERYRVPGPTGEPQYWLHFEDREDIDVTESVDRFRKEATFAMALGAVLFCSRYPNASHEDVNTFTNTVQTMAVNTGLLEEKSELIARITQLPSPDLLEVSAWLVNHYSKPEVA